MKEHGRQGISGFVTFLPEGVSPVQVPVGEKELTRSLLDLAVRHRVPIGHSCGGGGSCGTCRVLVKEKGGELESRGDIEQAMADDRGFASNERLACQISPVTGLIVEVPATEPELDS